MLSFFTRPLTFRGALAWAAALLAAQALILYAFGQPALCECGYVKLWEGVVRSSGNSQHLSDWYTFSHVIHGFFFYWILGRVFPRMSIGARMLFALGTEAAWEVTENTPAVIERYREQALAQGYAGDSIVNSLSDSLAMIAGFFMARTLPVFFVVALALLAEAATLYIIRDSLLLNIIGLLYPLDFISSWQSGV